MNTEKALSKLLQQFVDRKVLSEEVAKRFNTLETEPLQIQAIKRWSAAVDQAALDLANQLAGKDVKVLYDRRDYPEDRKAEMTDAVGEDLLDRYSPHWGEVGGVLRHWVRKGWQSGRNSKLLKWAVAIWLIGTLWAPAVWVMSVPYHSTRKYWAKLHPGKSEDSGLRTEINNTPPAAPLSPQHTGLMTEINKTLASPALRPEHSVLAPAVPTPVPAPRKSFFNSFTQQLLKNADGTLASAIPIAPLAEGVIATKNAAITAQETRAAGDDRAALAVPVPQKLRWQRAGKNAARLTWDTPAEGTAYRYNIYASYAGDPASWDTGNDEPLNGPEIIWTAPAAGIQLFELYLKTVDAQGRESAPSNHIAVDLR